MTEASQMESRADFPIEEFVATEVGAFTSTVTNGEVSRDVVVLDVKMAEIGEDARFECHVQIAFDRAGFVEVFTEALAGIAANPTDAEAAAEVLAAIKVDSDSLDTNVGAEELRRTGL